MTRSKVKVTRPLKLEILQFSKSISSAIFNVSWEMTTDSETMEQYLNFVRTRFLISVPVFVSCDYEPQSRMGLIFHTNIWSITQNRMIPKCSNLVQGMILGYPRKWRLFMIGVLYKFTRSFIHSFIYLFIINTIKLDQEKLMKYKCVYLC